MAVNLGKMSEKELNDLKSDIDKELVKRTAKNRAEARKALEKTAKEFGFSVQELLGAKVGATKSTGTAKYMNPDNPAQTWTGKGRQPGWFKDAISGGKSPEDLEI